MRRTSSSSKGPSQRQLRAAELIRHALVEIFRRDDLRDPALRNLSITVSEVRMTPDLRQATVYCTPLGGAGVEQAVEALNRAAAHIRGLLGRSIDLKFTPSVRFRADESFSEAQRIDELLKRPDVARDLGKKSVDSA